MRFPVALILVIKKNKLRELSKNKEEKKGRF